MHCEQCKTRIAGGMSLTCCPVCGSLINEKTRKPSFERTWAMMSEDSLKRKVDPKILNEAWNWYEKAILNDPSETGFVVRFLQAYPSFQPDLNVLKSKVQGKVSPEEFDCLWQAGQAVWKQVLVYGLLLEDPASTIQLINTRPELGAEILALLETQNHKGHELLPELPEEAALQSRLAQVHLPVEVQPVYFWLKGEYSLALAAFKTATHVDLKDAVLLESPTAFERLLNLANDSAKRVEQMEKAMTDNRMDHLLDLLYRPLLDNENAFAHLYQLPASLPGYLMEHKQEWQDLTLDTIEKDQALRGIHLALQTLRNQNPNLASDCDHLLEKQYEKAYLRPFKEIEKTDFRFV